MRRPRKTVEPVTVVARIGLFLGFAIWLGLSVLILTVILGVVYQGYGSRRDARMFPPPGHLVDVGGYRMHIRCAGEGSPPVILDSGIVLFSSGWQWVIEELASSTRVCAPDRAGLGWSEAGPEPYDGIQAAKELRAVLEGAGIERPFVYVGHSFGGNLGLIYSHRYPGDVAGLVLVDPGNQKLDEYDDDYHGPCGPECTLASVLAHLGVARLVWSEAEFLDDERLPRRAVAEFRARYSDPGVVRYLVAAAQYVPRIMRQTAAVTSLGDLPLTVVHSSSFGELLNELADDEDIPLDREQIMETWRQTVALSTRGRGPFEIAGANHISIIAYQSHARELASYIRSMVEDLRASKPGPAAASLK